MIIFVHQDDVREANREFLSQLPPELVGDIVIDEEDVSFPSVVSCDPVVVSKGGAHRMDVS